MDGATLEAQIAQRCAAAGLRLRFDKVVVRLFGRLKVDMAGLIPGDQTLVVCIAAPIRSPAATADAMAQALRTAPPLDPFRGAINGNDVQARRIEAAPAIAPRLLGFAHNPDSDARLIFDIVETRLREIAQGR